MTLFLRCMGALTVLGAAMGYASTAFAEASLKKNDPALVYVNGQFIGSGVDLFFGVLLILLAKSLVVLLSRGLKEEDF